MVVEPISLLWGATKLAKNLWEVSEFLVKFARGVQSVDEDLDGLLTEINSLANLTTQIEVCLKSDLVIRAVRQAEQHSMCNGFADLDMQLLNCTRTIVKLREVLKIDEVGDLDVLRRVIKHFRLEYRQDDIARYRQQLQSHEQCLSASLQIIHLCQSLLSDDRNQRTLQEMYDKLVEIMQRLSTSKLQIETTMLNREKTEVAAVPSNDEWDMDTTLLQSIDAARRSSFLIHKHAAIELERCTKISEEDSIQGHSVEIEKERVYHRTPEPRDHTPHEDISGSQMRHLSDTSVPNFAFEQHGSFKRSKSTPLSMAALSTGSKDVKISSEEFEAAMAQAIREAGLRKGRDDKPFADEDFDTFSRLLLQAGKVAWGERPRTYLILRMIGEVNLMDDFIMQGCKDVHLPYTAGRLPDCVGSVRAKEQFLGIQPLVLNERSANLVQGGPHRHFGRSADVGFTVIRRLGGGGQGAVDQVRSKLSLQEYARKRIDRPKVFSKDRKALQDFENEVEQLKRLEHRHLVRFVGSYTDPKFVGIIMEPVADMDLLKYLMRPNFPAQDLANLMSFFGCLCSAVQYLHNQHVRHKDIKPSNILVVRERVMITDFGIARHWNDSERDTTSGPPGAYTIAYAAPEVNKHQPRNVSADIWSLGCVFIDILTVLMHSTLDQRKLYFAQQGDENIHFWNNRDALNGWLDILHSTNSAHQEPLRWIRQMTADDPKQRPSAGDLLEKILVRSEDSELYCGICCSGLPSSEETSWQGSDVEDDKPDEAVGTSPDNTTLQSQGSSSIQDQAGTDTMLTEASSIPFTPPPQPVSPPHVPTPKIPRFDFQPQTETFLTTRGFSDGIGSGKSTDEQNAEHEISALVETPPDGDENQKDTNKSANKSADAEDALLSYSKPADPFVLPHSRTGNEREQGQDKRKAVIHEHPKDKMPHVDMAHHGSLRFDKLKSKASSSGVHRAVTVRPTVASSMGQTPLHFSHGDSPPPENMQSMYSKGRFSGIPIRPAAKPRNSPIHETEVELFINKARKLFESDSTMLEEFLAEHTGRPHNWRTLLLAAISPTSTSRFLQTMLHLTSVFNDTDLAASIHEVYIEAGARINALNFASIVPLQYAASKDHARLVMRLLDAGADVSHRDLRGCTALHVAAQCKSDAVAEILIQAMSADQLDIKDSLGLTAFHKACREGSLAIVEMLANAGADVFTLDIFCRPALVRCHETIYPQVYHLIQQKRSTLLRSTHIGVQNTVHSEKATAMRRAVTPIRAALRYDVGVCAVPSLPERSNCCEACQIAQMVKPLLDAFQLPVCPCACSEHLMQMSELTLGHSGLLKLCLEESICGTCQIARHPCGEEARNLTKTDLVPICSCEKCGSDEKKWYYLPGVASLDEYRGHAFYDEYINKCTTEPCSCRECSSARTSDAMRWLAEAGFKDKRTYRTDPDRALEWLIQTYGALAETEMFYMHDTYSNIAAVLLDCGARINSRGRDGDTLLHKAVKCQDLTMMSLLVKRGANLNIENSLGWWPIQSAIGFHSPLSLRYLLRAGANIDKLDSRGRTGKYTGSLVSDCVTDEQYGRTAYMLPMILAHRPNLDLHTELQRSPLRLAISHQNPVPVQILLKAGVGMSQAAGCIQATFTLDAHTVLATLIEHGVKLPDLAISVAAIYRASKCTAILLDRQDCVAHINDKDQDGETALHLISCHRTQVAAAMAESILAAGADISLEGVNGMTALHYAARAGNLAIVRMLLEAGAIPEAQDHDGRTACDLAISKRHKDVVEFLGGRLKERKWYRMGS